MLLTKIETTTTFGETFQLTEIQFLKSKVQQRKITEQTNQKKIKIQGKCPSSKSFYGQIWECEDQ